MAIYLVTGGCGFIGTHLVDALVASGHNVRVFDNLSTGKTNNIAPEVQLIVGDIVDRDCLVDAISDVDACFHLAAVASVEQCHADWPRGNAVNLGGTVNVLDAAFKARPDRPIPVIYASSAAVYGNNQNVPLKETEATRPISAYGVDKLGCELHGQIAREQFGVPTVGLRLFNVYGPGQDPKSPYSGVISTFSHRISHSEPLTIHGDGGQTRDFVYVKDVVAHFIAALDCISTAPPVMNVCSGRELSIMELAQHLGDILGKTADISCIEPRPGDIRHSRGNPRLANASLGLVAETEIGVGLRATLHSMKSL